MQKIFILFTAILLLCGCHTARSLESDFKSLKLGYCPTMQTKAENLARQNENTELIRFGSADEALYGLKNNFIDIAIIGRKAKADEIENMSEKRLEANVYTLINSEKRIIDHREIGAFEIKTCIDENIAREKFSELDPVFDDCQFADGGIWLISWDDFTDEMELLIPVDENRNKVAKYRTPFLYGDKLFIDKFYTG